MSRSWIEGWLFVPEVKCLLSYLMSSMENARCSGSIETERLPHRLLIYPKTRSNLPVAHPQSLHLLDLGGKLLIDRYRLLDRNFDLYL